MNVLQTPNRVHKTDVSLTDICNGDVIEGIGKRGFKLLARFDEAWAYHLIRAYVTDLPLETGRDRAVVLTQAQLDEYRRHDTLILDDQGVVIGVDLMAGAVLVVSRCGSEFGLWSKCFIDFTEAPPEWPKVNSS